MARIRSIHPEFWEDEDIGALSRDARLLFIGTWNLADDEGLLRWAPSYLKASVFMYDDDVDVAEVERLMGELADANLVFPYRGGKALQRLGWIPSFRKHQKPNRPQPSKLPPPSLQNTDVRERYAARDDWTCGVCGDEILYGPALGAVAGTSRHRSGRVIQLGLSLDHRNPRSNGGGDYPSNIQAAHGGCNSSKGSKIPHDLLDSVNDSLSDAVNDSLPEGRGVGEEMEGSGTPLSASTPTGTRLAPTSVTSPAAQVFAAWQEATGKHRAKLDDKRRRIITRALKDFPLDDVLDAARGWRHSPHHRGENERHTVYNELDLLLRDAAHIEQFRDLERDGPPVVAGTAARPKSMSALDEAMATVAARGAR